MLFQCPIQVIWVNNSLLPTRVFTSFWIKTVVFRMILICDVVFGYVYTRCRGVEIVKFSTCPGTSKKPKCTCPKEQISLYLTVLKQFILHKEYETRYISTLINSMDPDQLASLVNSVHPDQLASEEAS